MHEAAPCRQRNAAAVEREAVQANAAGAFTGELALTDGVAYGCIPWIGVGFAALGLAFSLLSHRLDRHPPHTKHDAPRISTKPALTAVTVPARGDAR